MRSMHFKKNIKKTGKYTVDNILSLWETFRRLMWPVALGLAAFYAIPVADRRVVAYKVAIIVVGWIIWHLLRRQTIPYMDFEACLKAGGGTAVAAGLVMAASCLAVVLGLALSF